MVTSTSSEQPEPKSAKGRRTRQQLLAAAKLVFEERGYFETRVTDIVERGEVALGSFYRYFTNKDDLLLALLEAVTAELYQSTQGLWDRELDTRTNLQRTTEGYLAAYRRNGRLIRALLQMSAVSPRCAAAWWELRQRTYQLMTEHLPPAAVRDPGGALTVSALAGMVEQFARHWYVEAPENGHAAPEPAAASQVLAALWYDAAYRPSGA